MPSLFSRFRKHQKAFYAIAAVLAIFIFVIGDAVMSWVGQTASSGGQSPNTEVTSWDGGSLKAHELDMLARRRYFLNEFLSRVYYTGKTRAEAAGEPDSEPNVPAFFLPRSAERADVMQICVRDRLLADQARAAGMSVSDMMINDYIRKTGRQHVSKEEVQSILNQLGSSEDLLFSGLRELLLGNLYANSVSETLRGVEPVQMWNDWLMINDRVAVDAAILPVEKFIADVPEPTEAQLIAFYEQFKDRVGGLPVEVMGVELPSSQPGFREPRRVKLKYLMGDVTAWTQDRLASVTDEEIADYYERNKRSQFTKLGSDESDKEEDAEEKKGESEEKASTDTTAKESADEESPDDDKADSDDKKKEDDVEYEPLEKVKDDIRNQLANDKAVVDLKRAMESAYGELQSEFNRYGGEVVMAQAEERDPPPVPERLADLAPLAKEKKLIFEETVPLSDRELFETMVGKAMDVQTSSSNVTMAAFTGLRPYEPFLAQDLDGYWYLALKVEDIPSRVPELKEIREEVVTSWKHQQAAELALKKSEELAKEAQESGKSLADIFADKGFEVVTSDLFSSITFGNTPVEMQQGFRLGDAPPLTAVGPDFMGRVFSMKPDEVTGLLNFDHTQAYVLKLSRHERTEDELRRAFLNEINNSQAMKFMEGSRSQSAQQMLMDQINQRINLDKQSLYNFLQSVSKE